MGKVYWITGLSGAGKTTIGKLFYHRMKQVFPNTVFLDGNVMGGIFEQPKDSDLVLENNGDITPEEQAEKIIRYFSVFDEL